jgi:Zn ribbon nucleic-acid-binding protein
MTTPVELCGAYKLGLLLGGVFIALVALCWFLILRWLSTGLQVTQFQNGFWLIRWCTNKIDSVETVQCGDRSLQLTLRRINDQVTLSIKENKGKARHFHLILI